MIICNQRQSLGRHTAFTQTLACFFMTIKTEDIIERLIAEIPEPAVPKYV